MYTSLTNGEDVERRTTLTHLALNLAQQSEAISRSEYAGFLSLSPC